MSKENSYVINGKEYTESEIISVHEYWQSHCDVEDIEDAIEHIINNSDDSELVSFVVDNMDNIMSVCKKHLLYWHNVRESTLSDSELTIFYLTRQLIDCIYYDSEGKTPHSIESKSSENLPF